MFKHIREFLRLPAQVRFLTEQNQILIDANLKLMRETHALNEKIRDYLALSILNAPEVKYAMDWASGNVEKVTPSEVWAICWHTPAGGTPCHIGIDLAAGPDMHAEGAIVGNTFITHDALKGAAERLGVPVVDLPLIRQNPADIMGLPEQAVTT